MPGTIDPSIPLSYQPFKLDYNQIAQQQQIFQRNALFQQQQQTQNAFKQLLSDPNNLNEDGIPTDSTFGKLIAANPQEGSKIVNTFAGLQEKRALGRYRDSEAGKIILDESDKINGEAYEAYENSLKDGKSPEAAKAIGQEVYTEQRNALAKSGLLTNNQIERSSPEFNPQKALATSMTLQAKRKFEEQQKLDDLKLKDEERKEKNDEERTREDRARDGRAARNESDRISIERARLAEETRKDNAIIDKDRAEAEKTSKTSGTGGQGGRESVLIQRTLTLAKDASSEIKNLAELPITSRTGLFSGDYKADGVFSIAQKNLANTLTKQSAQDLQVSVIGLGKALAGLESGGLQTNAALIKQFEKLAPVPGDTNATVLRKMATVRQSAENAVDSMLANPRLADTQKEAFLEVKKNIQESVPYTPHDVTEFEQKGKKNQSISDFAKEKLKKDDNTSQTIDLGDGFVARVRQ